MHRFLRLLCLLTAIAVLLGSAQISRRLAQIAMKEIGPIDPTLPELTRLMVVRVADGSFPTMLLAAAAAAVLAALGLFAIFSSRLSPNAAGTIVVVTCTIAFATALALLASTAVAISIGRGPLP